MDKKETKNFEKFISYLKKFPTNEVIKKFSYWERISTRSDMENEKIFPWLFIEIIYYSCNNSNDYKNYKNLDIKKLYYFYKKYYFEKLQKYQKENFNNQSISNLLCSFLYGTSQKQFKEQLPYKFFENRFNRNIYLLKNQKFNLNSKNRMEPINIELLLKLKFDINLNEFISYMFVLFSISFEDTEISESILLNMIEYNDTKFENFVNALSIDYDDIRENLANYNLINFKPIIISQKNEYLISDYSIFVKYLSDSIYWLFKDYFKEKKSDVFVQKFGFIFEDYVEEILCKTYGHNNIEKVEREKQKSVDFFVETKNFYILIEVKAGVAPICCKNEFIDIKKFDKFFNDNFIDATKQLNESAIRYKNVKSNKIIIPIIVNFDNTFINDTIAEHIELEEYNFEKDNLILFDIDDLENLISNLNNLEKLDNHIENVYKMKKFTKYNLLYNLNINYNYFYKNELDYLKIKEYNIINDEFANSLFKLHDIEC